MFKLRMRSILWATGSLAGAFLGLGAILGCCVFASPPYRGSMNDNFDGKRFVNQNGNRQSARLRDLIRWALHREPGPWDGMPDEDLTPGPPPPKRVDGGRLRATFIGHNTYLLQMDGLNVLTDPVWSERVGPVSWAGPKRVRPPGIRFEDLPPIDLVVISHNHYDHLDMPTIKRLVESHNPRIVAPLGNMALFEAHGLGGTVELDWWQSYEVSKDVVVEAVPAQHFSGRGLSDRDRTLWAGFVISGPSGRIYFAGDTGFGPHFAQVKERFADIRLVILPIGAYRPRWFMSSVHISPEEAVEAQNILRAKSAVGSHFGTFKLADDGRYESVETLARIRKERGEDHNPAPVKALGFGEGYDCP